MDFLAFRLYAPLASWGEAAVGEHRPSYDYPSRSAIIGLLAAALGIRRHDDAALAALADSVATAVAVYSTGKLLRDYHTAQVPSAKDLKKRPHRTRADELSVPRRDLNTILSTRDYRQDALAVVLLWLRRADRGVSLAQIEQALRTPRFVLYLGRKSCPPALPMQPHCVSADSLAAALAAAQFAPIDGLRDAERVQRMAFEPDPQVALGWPDATVLVTPRKDEPGSRRRWQFADRAEHVVLVAPDASEVPA